MLLLRWWSRKIDVARRCLMLVLLVGRTRLPCSGSLELLAGEMLRPWALLLLLLLLMLLILLLASPLVRSTVCLPDGRLVCLCSARRAATV